MIMLVTLVIVVVDTVFSQLSLISDSIVGQEISAFSEIFRGVKFLQSHLIHEIL